MRPVAIVSAGVSVDDAGPFPPGVDAGRLRRMDRFGRMGFLAGAAALGDRARGGDVDPRAGAFLGTAYGCRDSITSHAALLASAARVEELSPAVFAQTVHNTVCGELAIAWSLGGASEVLTSGRTAGLEAVLLAAWRLEAGALDLAVGGGAEGLCDAMRAAWREERALYPAGAALEAADGGAALLLEAQPARVPAAWFVDGAVFFEPAPSRVPARIAAFLEIRSAGTLVVASPDLDGALSLPALASALPGGWTARYAACADAERFAVSGPRALADELARGPGDGVLAVAVRDPEGPVAVLVVERAVSPRSA